MAVCFPGWNGLVILFRWLSVVLVGLESNPTRTTDSHLKRIISTNCCIHTVVPPDDGPRYARNMQRLTKYTKNKLCIKLVFLYTIQTASSVIFWLQYSWDSRRLVSKLRWQGQGYSLQHLRLLQRIFFRTQPIADSYCSFYESKISDTHIIGDSTSSTKLLHVIKRVCFN